MAPGEERPFDRSAYFNDYNRNKRGLVLELHELAGLAAFRKMVWLAIAVDSDEAWIALRGVVADNRLDNLRSRRSKGRRAAESFIDGALNDWCREQPAQNLAEALQAAGVAASPVRSQLMLTTDPHLLARDYVQAYDHPLTGKCATFRPVWRLADRPLGEIRPAPMSGQHTREVLSSFAGLDDAAVDALGAAGVTATTPVA